MTTDVTGILRQTDLLRSVPAADLAGHRRRRPGCGPSAAARSCSPRDDPGDTLIVVISGRVKVVVRSADGGELTLDDHPVGRRVRRAQRRRRRPQVRRRRNPGGMPAAPHPARRVQDICARVPSAAQALTAFIAATLRRLTEAASDLVFLDLPRRVAKVLLSQPGAATASSGPG